MTVTRIQGFSGIVPVSGDRALPDSAATRSLNTWLYGGELRGLRPPDHLLNVTNTTRRVFRVPKRTPGHLPIDFDDSIWMQFQDPDTDVLRGQLLEDQYERYYFCSPSTGPMFNTYARMAAGQTPYRLGVPGPITANLTTDPPAIAITGGNEPAVDRSYVYTFVNQFGEESTPSLPGTKGGNSNGVWTITNIQVPPALGPDYPTYDHKVLYRTITGASGVANYHKVVELPLAATSYVDDGTINTDEVVVRNLMLESTAWSLPPTTLKGFIAMPNGFLIGFDGSNVYFSESYHWHAWPAAYKQATETPVVGLGVIGQTCVVCTQGYPSTVTGIKPSTCSFTKATADEPCLSRGSIVSTPSGVIYASQNGLVMIGPDGIQNVTETLITREDWLRDYLPQFIRAARYQNGYLALRDFPSPQPNSGFFLDPTSLKVALTEVSDFDNVVALNSDFWSGEVFMLVATGSVVEIQHWDAPSDDLMPVQWRSKEFQYPKEDNFGAYAIYWDDARYSNVNYATDVLPTTEHVRFKVWANRTLVYDQPVPRNGKPVRLPSGFKADIWQFEIRARAPVYSLHVGSTIKELRSV